MKLSSSKSLNINIHYQKHLRTMARVWSGVKIKVMDIIINVCMDERMDDHFMKDLFNNNEGITKYYQKCTVSVKCTETGMQKQEGGEADGGPVPPTLYLPPPEKKSKLFSSVPTV